MIKCLFVICLLAGLPASAFPQSCAGLQAQLNELTGRVKSLEEENHLLLEMKRSTDSLEYLNIRQNIFEAYSGLSTLEFDYRNTVDKIAVTGLFTRLMQANNPNSDILGFRFSELIFSSAEKHFAGKLESEGDRKRFSQIISKIIENPVVSSLAQTNPVTSVVASIIGTIATFSTARIQALKEAGRINTLAVTQEDVFDSKSISAFRSDLQVYIGFYDDLIGASEKYLAGLENLEMKYAFLVRQVESYREKFDLWLKPAGPNPLISLTQALPEPGRANLDFNGILKNENIMASRELAQGYPLVRQSVENLKTDYNTLLSGFLEDYCLILEKARNFPGDIIDHGRIDQLTGEIRAFLMEQGQ